MKNAILITLCVFLYGTATFLKRLSLFQLHPYQFLLLAGISYFSFTPLWYWLINNQTENLTYHAGGVFYVVLYSVFSVMAGFIIACLLRNTNNPGTIIVLVNLSSLVTLMLSYLFLNEQLNFNKIIAIILAIISLILMNF